jgi:hypothetical protein
MFVKKFINNINLFLGVCHCYTLAVYTRCLITLFKEMAKIFNNKAKKLEEKEKRI